MNFTQPNKTGFVSPKSRGELPHLYKEGGTYFVTFRQFDAVVPKSAGAVAPEGSKDRSFDDPHILLKDYDSPITMGSCLLFRPDVAEIVQSAVRFFEAKRYELLAWCVMPNHVHVVFAPLPPYQPNQILHSWKSYTSHAIAKLLLRSGAFWERESFDHLVRNVQSLERFVRYTEDNPVAAALCQSASKWDYSSARNSLLTERH
jgi:putative transposase